MAPPIGFYILCMIAYIYRFFVKENWKKKGLAKKVEVQSQIPQHWQLRSLVNYKISETSETDVMGHFERSGLLTEKELALTENYTAKELLEKLRTTRLTSTELTLAFCKRAALAHQLTNCCSELMFDLAKKRATELDKYMSEHGSPMGPLHGLPISLKDTFNVPGYDSAIGYVSFIGNKAGISKPSNIVQMLLDMGAVLYVKTNVPQTLICPDTDNHVIGRTLNPKNTSLNAGGSSGGEAALIRQRGSLLGIGTDVGGSLRIPSLCCGTYCIKPSTDRLPYGGQTLPGVKDKTGFGIFPTAGIIGTNVEDIRMLWDFLIQQEPWKYDPNALHIPAAIHHEKKSYRIGFLLEDEAFPLHPPMRRIMEEVVIKVAGNHQIVFIENNFPPFLDAWANTVHHFVLENSFHVFGEILRSGEPPVKSLSTNKVEAFGLPPMTLKGASKMVLDRARITRDWNQYFIDHDLDAILSPGAPFTAPPHDTFGIVPYTSNWNLVDFPSTIIPYGKVESCDTNDLVQHYPNDYSRFYAEYDQAKYMGGAGHLQLTCRRYEEDKLLAITAAVEKLLR